MFETDTKIISESTYIDKQGFEIREGLDEYQNRVLLKICGRGSFFSIPDGVYALAADAFSEVTESMRYIFIPKSVKIIPEYTFMYFRGSMKREIDDKELHELDIFCEADRRPDGFYVKVIADTFQEDYELYTEYHYITWCGHTIYTERNREDSGSDDIVCYGLDMPHVHWGVSAQESLKYCDN